MKLKQTYHGFSLVEVPGANAAPGSMGARTSGVD